MCKAQLKNVILRTFCNAFSRSSPQPVALMYHSISPTSHPQSITPEMFRSQLEYLANNGFKTVLAKDLLSQPTGSGVKLVCITFDDGFLDNFTYAVPLLREFKMKATFFIPTKYIGQPSFLAGFSGMGWDELKAVSSDPLFEIGAHAETHRRLDMLSEEESRKEIENSKNILESNLMKSVGSFAYPYGSYSQRDARLVQAAGFTVAFSTVRRRMPKKPPSYSVPRLGVDIVTAPFFADFFKAGYEFYWRIFDATYMRIKRVYMNLTDYGK